MGSFSLMAALAAPRSVLLPPTALTAADMGRMPEADGQALLDYISKSDPA